VTSGHQCTAWQIESHS